jgi:hypothetical protein
MNKKANFFLGFITAIILIIILLVASYFYFPIILTKLLNIFTHT